MKITKSKIIIAIVVMLVVYIAISHFISLHKSVDIDKEYLSRVRDDIKEVIYVEKFTDNESVAIALGKNEADEPYIFIMWDAWNRYTHTSSFGIHSVEQLNDIYDYEKVSDTKFGQPYYCLFQNPTTDTVTLDGKEHKVFKFNCTLDGEEYYLGFYCGLMES